jgi:exosortase family protein XrtM
VEALVRFDDIHVPPMLSMPMIAQRIVCFIAVFVALNRAFLHFWNDGLSHWIIDWATVRPSAWIAAHLEGSSAITANGPRLQAPDGSIRVQFGCEGTDVLMLLVSALLVTPIPWGRRLAGLAVGALFVFAVNQARVLALFYALRRAPSWFGQVHGLIAPLVVVVLVVLFFLWWVRGSPAAVEASSIA